MGKQLQEYEVIIVMTGFPESHCKPVMDVIRAALGDDGPVNPEEVGFLCVPGQTLNQQILVHMKEYVFDVIEEPLRLAVQRYMDGRDWPNRLSVKRLEREEIDP